MFEKLVEYGDIVKVNYIGKYESGKIFDSSIEEMAKNCENYNPQGDYTPRMVKVGAAQVIAGFESALIGMKEGEEKEEIITPEEGYGNFDPSLVQNIPMGAFQSAGITPEPGQLLSAGEDIGRVIEVNNSDVEVDSNSPLAGETLVFEIKVEDIIKEK